MGFADGALGALTVILTLLWSGSAIHTSEETAPTGKSWPAAIGSPTTTLNGAKRLNYDHNFRDRQALAQVEEKLRASSEDKRRAKHRRDIQREAGDPPRNRKAARQLIGCSFLFRPTAAQLTAGRLFHAL
jgi:hypothetical protein